MYFLAGIPSFLSKRVFLSKMWKSTGSSTETVKCVSVASREEIKKLPWTVISKSPQAGYSSLGSGDCTVVVKLLPPVPRHGLGFYWVTPFVSVKPL